MTDQEGGHWSIGEVLSLIQKEFPDVTISKIRFLESQGLISPERTPSGYRRFFQPDLERLQWILEQQRDNYLPLKVIRDRLESGDLDGLNEVESSPVLPFEGTAVEKSRTAPRIGRPLAKPEVDEVSSDGPTEDAPSAPSSAPDSAAEQEFAVETVGSTSMSRGSDPASSEDDSTTTEVDSSGGVDRRTPSPERREHADSEHADGEQDSRRPGSNRPNGQTERRGRGTDRRGTGESGIAATAAMTKDELAEASGCTLEAINDLERFGLLAGRTIGPTVLYDSEALLIAKLAAKFGAHGLEARHLRTLKIGAEREVGLLTQVIEPMLYRRDQEARERSIAALDELVELSASLRSILVRQTIREQLPSQRG